MILESCKSQQNYHIFLYLKMEGFMQRENFKKEKENKREM